MLSAFSILGNVYSGSIDARDWSSVFCEEVGGCRRSLGILCWVDASECLFTRLSTDVIPVPISFLLNFLQPSNHAQYGHR